MMTTWFLISKKRRKAGSKVELTSFLIPPKKEAITCHNLVSWRLEVPSFYFRWRGDRHIQCLCWMRQLAFAKEHTDKISYGCRTSIAFVDRH
jgi:hypothetical protein